MLILALGVLELAKKLKGNCCERLVKYTGQELTITGTNIGIGNFKVDIGGLSNKIKEITVVPQIMIALDNYQYLLCRQASELSGNTSFRENCLRIRLMHILAFTQLHAILSIPKPSKELRKQIVEWTRQMNELTMQSIKLLMPSPQMTLRDTESLGLIIEGPESKDKKVTSRVRMRKIDRVVTANGQEKVSQIMKYQGIDEKQMQEALSILR